MSGGGAERRRFGLEASGVGCYVVSTAWCTRRGEGVPSGLGDASTDIRW